MTAKNSSIVFPVVLKTIIQHTIRDNPKFSLNEKQIRARLRADEAVKKFHLPNTSHVGNNMSQYDAIRLAYDDVYKAKLANARKRPARKAKIVKDEAPANVEA